MEARAINIVSFNVPYPADYGGVIDVFYRIKALSDLGVKVYLHCFEYGREVQSELEKLCEEVLLYPRNTKLIKQLNKIPFIVNSRDDIQLLENLKKNKYPILFEGLHSCYFLGHEDLTSRKKAVRMHNIEHRYYAQLAKSESNWLRRNYFGLESNKLKSYQSILKHANRLFAISASENDYFLKLGYSSVYLPVFCQKFDSNGIANKKAYAIYHGNLEVAENERAVLFLLEVFSGLNSQLIITGRNPGSTLKKKIAGLENVRLVESPDERELNTLVDEAQLHCLPTFQSTGIKLKLIRSLTTGSHVVANDMMLKGTELEQFCAVANSVSEWRNKIKSLTDLEVKQEELEERFEFLNKRFNNLKNAKILLEWLDEAP